MGLWNPESGQQLGQFLGHQSAVSSVVAVVSNGLHQHALGRAGESGRLDVLGVYSQRRMVKLRYLGLCYSAESDVMGATENCEFLAGLQC